jgi:recombination protein RecA
MARASITKKISTPFISSGSTLLDCVLGGGWAEGRVANIVGDKSAGKTLLAIEACANFALDHPAEHIAYRESEAAFDMTYAQSMGMPIGVDWSEEIRTVEDMDRDLARWLSTRKNHEPNLYVLDSLDALSDQAEASREIGEASYGVGKAKAMSEMFRRRTAELREKRCTLIIISQIRDKIGVTFGETKTRSGGRALDFYSSQVVWLSELKKIKRTVTGVDRITGVEIRARNRKNKIGKPFRETDLTILFNYGIDDEQSMLDWLKKNKGERWVAPVGLEDYATTLKRARHEKDREVISGLHAELAAACRGRWNEIENALEPPISKYGK